MADFSHTLVYSGERFPITQAGVEAIMEAFEPGPGGIPIPRWVTVETGGDVMRVRVWPLAPIAIIQHKTVDVLDNVH